ncbi:MAG TPA: ATP-dependent zinc metalloprotease FtsH [Acidimicrobiales bacterium]|nr:ATP-dependent zinc metalloprotease FtsH [Acidimicrobiales bacterium]
MPPPGQHGPQRQKSRASRWQIAGVVALFVVVLFVLFNLPGGASSKKKTPEVTLSGAVQAIKEGKVGRLHLNDGSRRATLILNNGTEVQTAYPVGSGPELTNTAIEYDVKVTASPNKAGSMWGSLLLSLLPVGLLIAFFIFFMGPRMGMNVGKLNKSRREPTEVPDTRFADVAGVEEAVAEVKEIVEFLTDPDRFTAAGARMPRGVLLVGPPGTGKTLLARAVAGEAGVPFFALSGSDFVETFVGVGASRVRQVFTAARKHGRAIIFIDEIDAVGKARSSQSSGSGNEERENTLNQLLVEMDGFSDSGVIVLAATNRADVLDAALTRPGRFDRRVTVPAPDRVGRTKILELYARERRLDRDVDLVALARRTPGLTGADLALLMNEAALEAARSGSQTITNAHLQAALATAVMGRARVSAVVTERDRRITAWHEAGHAVAALLLPHADDPVSVTIVPRGQAGGVTWMGGNDNSFLTRSEAEARLVVAMAGRAAEEHHLDGDFTQGAASDFASATSLALSMVTEFGMSELGPTSRATYAQLGSGQADRIGEAVDRLLQQAIDTARDLIAANVPLLEDLVAELLREETVTGVQLSVLAGRHGLLSPAYAVDRREL